MGVFSILLLCIVVHIFFNKDSLKNKYLKYISIAMIIEVLVLNASFINIGGLAIGVKYFMNIVVFIYTIYFIFKENINFDKTMFFIGIIFLFLIVIGILSEIIYPYSEYIINYDIEQGWDKYVLGMINKEPIRLSFQNIFLLYFKIVVFVLTTYMIKTICNRYDLIYILKNILKYTRFIIFFGFFEYIMKNIMAMPDVIEIFQYIMFFSVKEGQVSFLEDSYRLIGVSSEPSYFVYSLFLIAVLNIITKRIIRSNIEYQKLINYHKYDNLLIIILMILSGGFSCIWYISMLVIIYIISYYDIRKISLFYIIKLILSMTLFFIIIVGAIFYSSEISNNYIGERLDQVFEILSYIAIDSNVILSNSLNYGGSNVARLFSIYEVMLDFINRPILGLGVGVQIAHSGFVMLLSDFGILGVYFLGKLVLYKVNKKIKYDNLFLLIFFVIVNIPIGTKSIGYEINTILFIELTSIYFSNKYIKYKDR